MNTYGQSKANSVCTCVYCSSKSCSELFTFLQLNKNKTEKKMLTSKEKKKVQRLWESSLKQMLRTLYNRGLKWKLPEVCCCCQFIGVLMQNKSFLNDWLKSFIEKITKNKTTENKYLNYLMEKLNEYWHVVTGWTWGLQGLTVASEPAVWHPCLRMGISRLT